VPAATGGKVFSFLFVSQRFLWKERTVKTRKVSGIDCGAECFAYVSDPDDPKTWLFCVRVLGDTAKTVNAVKNSAYHWEQQKQAIPVGQRAAIWNRLVGACLVLGVRVQKDPIVTVTDDELDFILAERQANELVSTLNFDWTK